MAELDLCVSRYSKNGQLKTQLYAQECMWRPVFRGGQVSRDATCGDTTGGI